MADVSVGTHSEDMVRRMVKTGRYAGISDIHQAGLRLTEKQELARQAKLEILQRLIAEGEASRPPEPMESAAQIIADARRLRSSTDV